MSTKRNRAAAIAALAAAAGAGAFLLTIPGPALAGTPATSTTTCPAGCDGTGPQATTQPGGVNQNGYGNGYAANGKGYGNGAANGMRQGAGNGAVGQDPGTNLPAQGTLTEQQQATVQAMVEEEKLAHDVYLALADATGDVRFTRIAASEQRHMDALRVLLERYGLTDPTEGRSAGSFASAQVQDLYDRLVAQGKVSLTAALEVGRTIETMDIDDLVAAREGVSAADVVTVYERLEAGSHNHLRAFGG